MKITQVITETASSAVDTATHPSTTIPVIGTVGMGNLLSSLPDIINVCTALYLILLITHKGWRMYKEWKTGKEAIDG